MNKRSLLTTSLVTALIINSTTTRPKDSSDALVAGIIGGIAAGVASYLIYDYCTCDSRLVNQVEKFCHKDHDDSSVNHALTLLSDQKQISLLMSSHPSGTKYRSMLHDGIEELRALEQESIRYFNKLKDRRRHYSSHDAFYQESQRLQQALKSIELKCLELRSLLTVGDSLAASSNLIERIIAHSQNIAVLHHPSLAHSHHAELEHSLSGQDNLKEYWLLLNQTINQMCHNLEQLTKERLEMSRLLLSASALNTPQALRIAGEHQIAQLQLSEQELLKLIQILQHLQSAVGNHPRYGHDNQLYMVDHTRKLIAENEQLKGKISSLHRSIDNLEYEKRSLYAQISGLKDSIRSLEWQVAMNNRPAQPQVIIAQSR